MAANKEAVVFVLDANISMGESLYPAGNSDGTTRLDCAKQTVQEMISDLMIRSKTNEVCVVVLKTLTTEHHFYSQTQQEVDEKSSTSSFDKGNDDEFDPSHVPFPNITELSGDGRDVQSAGSGLSRPTTEILRQIDQIQSVTNRIQSRRLRGDFCDGIIVAADAMYRRTVKKKYQRRIIVISDAEHEVMVDQNQILIVLDSLRAMECRLEVIGLDFSESAEFHKPAEPPKPKTIQSDPSKTYDYETDSFSNDQDDANSGSHEASDNNSDDQSDLEEDEEQRRIIKQQNEQLLIGLTEKTGGYVIAAHEMKQILDLTLGKRIPKSTKRKLTLHIAPGLVLDTVRFCLLLSKTSAPSLKKEVVLTSDDDTGNPQPLKNALGEEMTSDIQTIISHWDPEKEDHEITDHITGAYRYGSDLVPIGDYDLQGLKEESDVCMKILGYMDTSKVPRRLLVGPAYALSGGESRRACAAISALAKALQKLQQVGIATLVKTKDAHPNLVGLFPLLESNGRFIQNPIHLVFMQLPFRGEVNKLSLRSFGRQTTASVADTIHSNSSTMPCPKVKACDDMIDSLMLPTDCLDYIHIPNPYIRAFCKTVVNRVVNPGSPVVSIRHKDDDLMATPKTILERCRPFVENFQREFPLSKNTKLGKNVAKSKSRPATYHDFLDDA